jgi:hypothetical protein
MAAASQEFEEGRLDAAQVRVIIEGSYATVIAQYEIERSGAPVVFEAPRLPGQILIVDRAFGPEGALEVRQLVDSRRITAPASVPGLAQFRISYRVEDDFSSIPIFVPNAPSAPRSNPVQLEIIGAAADADPENAVPPLQRGDGGALTATTAHLPTVIRLPAPRHGLFTTRVLVLAALIAVCLAGFVWAGQAAWGRRNRGAGAV